MIRLPIGLCIVREFCFFFIFHSCYAKLNLSLKPPATASKLFYECAMHILFWRILVILFLFLAFLGAILPVMPTTVFLILAAWAASKGWPKVDAWLLNHPRYGTTLRLWRQYGAVPRKAKWFATLMMSMSALVVILSPIVWWAQIVACGSMLIVGTWLWFRPELSERTDSVRKP